MWNNPGDGLTQLIARHQFLGALGHQAGYNFTGSILAASADPPSLSCRLANQVDALAKQNTRGVPQHTQVPPELYFFSCVMRSTLQTRHFWARSQQTEDAVLVPLGHIVYLLYRYTHGIIMLILACWDQHWFTAQCFHFRICNTVIGGWRTARRSWVSFVVWLQGFFLPQSKNMHA